MVLMRVNFDSSTKSFVSGAVISPNGNVGYIFPNGFFFCLIGESAYLPLLCYGRCVLLEFANVLPKINNN